MAHINRRKRLDPLHKDKLRLDDIQELKRIEAMKPKKKNLWQKFLSFFKTNKK
jgi:hypothetical protein